MAKRLFVSLVLSILSIVMTVLPALACTTTIMGKKASTDGSVIVSHSDDGYTNGSMVYVPAMDHPAGSVRSVYYSTTALDFKPEWGANDRVRLVTKERGPGYDIPDVPASIPLGSIPQVAHTYAYYDGNYGIMNEHQLSMGECTDKAKVEVEPAPGKRIFYSAELSRVALERCKTAREAIKLMGELIEKYGYYGTGETLLIGDTQEAWVMEMAPYDKDETAGVWVAKRVPDDEIFVAGNQFRIRDVIKDSPDMMFSANIFTVAQEKGWWNPSDGLLDFTKTYSDGEYHHPYYSLRRVWRVQSLVAPSLNLSPWVEDANTRAYDFSVKPDKLLSVNDIMAIHRDNYEGTEFDLTKGIAAGPFENPTRFEGQAESVADKEGRLTTLNGEFERPINIYRSFYVYVNQSRQNLPDAIGGVCWFGPDRPSTTVFMPFYAGALNLPQSLQHADPLKFDQSSMWMAINYVSNYALLKYNYMIKDISTVSNRYETLAFSKQKELENNALTLWNNGDKQGARQLLTSYSDKNAQSILTDWWKLSQDLYLKYNDGYRNAAPKDGGLAQPLFYPNWWLQQAGYENGPTTYQKRSAQ